MKQYKPYYRSKPVTVQARKEKRDATIMTIAVVIFTAFAFLGVAFTFSFIIRYISTLL
jgi:preprotein translocase subunit SecE